MIKITKYYFLLTILLFSIGGYGQLFPVNITPQVIPPYSLKLSEYSTSVSDKLILNTLLIDITESNLPVRFKLYIENNAGLSIQSTEVVIGANPIFLDGGVPVRLSNLDLQPYFALQNLKGITPQQYSVPLPEGLYRFCFEAYDAQSGRRVSRKSCATVYLVLNDPPFLNIPNRGEQVSMRDPQNIIFQWTPRHLNATNVEYEFTLAELWDDQMDPQAAFLASRPIYQTTTYATTLLYGPAETPLLPDKKYAWRVRAMVNDGISETSVFKNNGYSEIYHFTYADNCVEPGYVLAEAIGTTKEKILWQGVDHLRYTIQYRKKDVENAVWFDTGTVNQYTTIHNLKPGTTYEFRVGGQCLDNGAFTYSQIYEFTTMVTPSESVTYNCGITPELVIVNKNPLETLVINDVFTAGDFPVTVKEVEGANGYFSGWGYIVVPYLQDTKLKVSFNNIQINTDYQLTSGIVITDYDENWGGVDDIGNELDVLQDLIVLSTQAITVIKEELDNVVAIVKDNLDTNQQTRLTQEYFQEIIDDPNNGLTKEDRDKLQEFVDDKDKVKQIVEKAKEDFASGKNDAIIKENFTSNFKDTQNAEISAETFFTIVEQFEPNNNPNSNTIVYLSPAGIPITLPKNAIPRFLQNNTLKVAKGVLSGFTLDNKIYNGYFAKGVFKGYKLEKGGEPYEFPAITTSGNIKVVIGLKTPYLQCDVIFLEGEYSSSSVNKTGTGNLLVETQITFIGQSKGLSELSASYSTCLPNVSKVSFDKYVLGYYNYFDKGGFLRIVANDSGGISYIYAISNTEGGADFYQYNPKSGKWYVFTKPPVDCLSCDLNKMFAALYDPSAIGHFVLDTAGMIPLFGEAFDAINGVWYLIEGDGTNAVISFASTIPLVYATSAKYIGKIVKLADGSYTMIKFGDQASKQFLENVKRIDLDADGLKVLNKDLANKEFAEAIIRNPDLVDAWKILDDAGVDDVLRRNVDELELVGKNIDEIKKAGGYKAWKDINNAGGWKITQKIKNKYPNEALPKDGELWGIAKIENGLINPIGNKGKTFNEVDFVITIKGELKIGKKHHFLGNASDVEAAGTLKVVNGKVKKISNASGHYFPSIPEAEKFPQIFRQLGIDTKNASLEILYEDNLGNVKTIIKFLQE